MDRIGGDTPPNLPQKAEEGPSGLSGDFIPFLGGPGPVTTQGPPTNSLPESLDDATKWFLKNGETDYNLPKGVQKDTHTWGDVKYDFSETADNSKLPKGSPKSDSGFWLTITTSGTYNVGGNEEPWSHEYKNQYYIVRNHQQIYNQYTVYNSSGEHLPYLDTHYQISIPANLGKFKQEDPVGYGQFIDQFDKGIEKMTGQMLGQAKKQWQEEEKKDWGTMSG